MRWCGFDGASVVSRTWRRGRWCEGHGHAWYDTELHQLHRESSVLLFRQKAALSPASSSSSGGARGETPKEFGNLSLFPTKLAPFYSEDLADLADQIAGLLDTNAHALPSGLLAQALMLLFNSKLLCGRKSKMMEYLMEDGRPRKKV